MAVLERLEDLRAVIVVVFDILLAEERDVLLQWGLVPLPDNSRPGRITQSFHIDVLNASDMVLSSDGYTLRYRRF